MVVRSRQHPAAPWVTLLIGLAVLLDVLWIASRMQPAHATADVVASPPAAAAPGRTGPPSLHMHTVY
jgi:hypothetical protein